MINTSTLKTFPVIFIFQTSRTLDLSLTQTARQGRKEQPLPRSSWESWKLSSLITITWPVCVATKLLLTWTSLRDRYTFTWFVQPNKTCAFLKIVYINYTEINETLVTLLMTSHYSNTLSSVLYGFPKPSHIYIHIHMHTNTLICVLYGFPKPSHIYTHIHMHTNTHNSGIALNSSAILFPYLIPQYIWSFLAFCHIFLSIKWDKDWEKGIHFKIVWEQMALAAACPWVMLRGRPKGRVITCASLRSVTKKCV